LKRGARTKGNDRQAMRRADADNGSNLLRCFRKGHRIGKGNGMPALIAPMRLAHGGRPREPLAKQRGKFRKRRLSALLYHRFLHHSLPDRGSLALPLGRVMALRLWIAACPSPRLMLSTSRERGKPVTEENDHDRHHPRRAARKPHSQGGD